LVGKQVHLLVWKRERKRSLEREFGCDAGVSNEERTINERVLLGRDNGRAYETKEKEAADSCGTQVWELFADLGVQMIACLSHSTAHAPIHREVNQHTPE